MVEGVVEVAETFLSSLVLLMKVGIVELSCPSSLGLFVCELSIKFSNSGVLEVCLALLFGFALGVVEVSCGNSLKSANLAGILCDLLILDLAREESLTWLIVGVIVGFL